MARLNVPAFAPAINCKSLTGWYLAANLPLEGNGWLP
jgi:hypothetical protein